MVDPAWGSPNGDHKGRVAKDQASSLSSAMWVLGTAGKSGVQRDIEVSLPSREFPLLPRIQLMVPCSAQVPSVVANHVISVGPLARHCPLSGVDSSSAE